jgi:energy-coupling factor transport system ATP-binding protein
VSSHFIEFSETSFRYPEQNPTSKDSINSVSFSIDSGEYVAIVGANGSGKTTLVKLIDGLLLPTGGKLEVGDVLITEGTNLENIRKKVGIVFQSPEDQIVATTVEEDIAFGLENFGMRAKEMHTRVRKVMEGFDLWEIRNRPTFMLSGGQTQRLALAGVLAIQPECLIFDESTSMLDPAARKNLLGVMKSFHNEGKTIIHITHSMDEAAQADRVLVMKEGVLVFDGKPGELFLLENIDNDWNLEYPEAVQLTKCLKEAGVKIPSGLFSISELAKLILQQCHFHRVINIGADGDEPAGEIMVSVSDLTFEYLKGTPKAVQALGGVCLSVTQGQGHGLVGKTGSGKSTVLQHLNGLLQPQTGEIRVGNLLLNDPKITIKEIVQLVGLVMQNPENQFFEYYVGDEIAFGPKNIRFDGKLADRVQWAMEMVGLEFNLFKDRPIHTLSGGEKRKTALASILALKPRLLLLDEPTAGLDPKSRHEVISAFNDLKQNQMTIIVSSHNLRDIQTLTENMTLLENGHSVLNGTTRSILSDPDVLLNHGIDPPFITKLVKEINVQSKVDLRGICSIEEFIDAIDVGEHVNQ